MKNNLRHNSKKIKIIFAGYGIWGSECLEALTEIKDYEVVAVFIENEPQEGNKIIEKIAEKFKLKVHKEKIQVLHIEKYKPDLLINVGFHQIYKKDILSKVKGINIHLGDLPDYKGRSVLNHAIINGEDYVGVTVHWLTEDIDAGPILQQQHILIEQNDNATTLLEKTLEWYPRLLLLSLEKIAGKQRYFKQRKPEDSEVKSEYLQSIYTLHNFICALTSPFPNAFIKAGEKKIIFKESILKEEGGETELWVKIGIGN